VTVYLLDTNTCIQYLRNRKPHVVQRIQAAPPQDLRLCSIVVAELYHGAYKSPFPTANLALLATFCPRFLSIPFDDAAANQFGRIRAVLEALGTPIDPYDMQIAAIALVHNLILVTHNTAEFSRVAGLVLEDWELPPPP
jgi:tRNA(fMet)-specific endonuclease VapC